MSNMREIRGKQVSEGTIVEALKAYCGFEEKPVFDEDKAPVFSIVNDNRLVVKLTDEVKDAFKEMIDYPTNRYISFVSEGEEGSCNMGDTWAEVAEYYDDVPKSLFPKDYPDPVL